MEKVELIFKPTIGGTYEEAFGMMKEFQNAGMVGKNSKILFNDVMIPAGYYETSEESFGLYNALVGGDLDAIKASMPKKITESEMFSMESTVAESYKALHDSELSVDFLDELLENARENGAVNK